MPPGHAGKLLTSLQAVMNAKLYFAIHRRLEICVLTVLFLSTLWFQLEDMFQSIVTPQGIGQVQLHIKGHTHKGICNMY